MHACSDNTNIEKERLKITKSLTTYRNDHMSIEWTNFRFNILWYVLMHIDSLTREILALSVISR